MHALADFAIDLEHPGPGPHIIKMPPESRLLDIVRSDVNQLTFIFEVVNLRTAIDIELRLFKPMEDIPDHYFPVIAKSVVKFEIGKDGVEREDCGMVYACLDARAWDPVTRRVRNETTVVVPESTWKLLYAQ